MSDGESLAEVFDQEPDGGSTPAFLVAIRETRQTRWIALLAAGVLGLGLAWAHWLGLFAAGALVGLVSRDVPRAVAAGLAMGLVVLAIQVLAIPAMGPDEFFALSPPSYLAVAAALVAPAWGSLVRGVV